ncbi:biotin/lipoyl-binding protein [Pseudomonas izuensis]|uniref:biotin/lipoyl-binding protein n=1 Tax=Pseudomonas izuensis TaxID=2684212 RepID=UPI00135A7C0D|nr:biotin/lipoyl-binding protein [Pseudomonas izuensis]
MERPSFFRQEVWATGSGKQFGSVLIHQPLRCTLVAGPGLALVFAVIALAYFGTYTRKATPKGLLMPLQGMLRLTASGSGIVRDVAIREGEKVVKGQPLFTLSAERNSLEGGPRNSLPSN